MLDWVLYDLGMALTTLPAEKLLVGVREEGEKLRWKLIKIKSGLADAEKRELMMEENVKSWLDLLKDVVYDIEDVLDDWTMEVKLANKGKSKHDDIDQIEIASFDQEENKICSSSCIPTPGSCSKPIKKVKSRRHDIARRIEAINFELDEINKLKNDCKLQSLIPRVLTTSFDEVKDLHAQTIIKQKVIETLLRPAEGTDGGSKIQVISLVGMGGIGKTTIAQIVYNDANVKYHFDKLMWVCVSDSFNKMLVSKQILNSLRGNKSSDPEVLQQVLEEIHAFIEGKRFLLVLDDVWTENYGDWKGIMSSISSNCLPGSRVLVTTRNRRVAQAMKTNVMVPMNELPEEECLSLFQHFAFSGRGESERHNLESMAQEMAKRCKGLVLAAETLGRAMAFKATKREWEGVLKSNLWNFEDKEAGLLPALSLSYIDLPSPIKRCFASCCVFQKDQVMSKNDLVWLWMGLGLLGSETGQEIDGEDYFNILVARSFFKETVEGDIYGVKMHDIIHDFAQFLMKNEALLFSKDGEAINELILNKGSAKIRHLTMVSRRSQLPTLGIDRDLKRLRMLAIEAPDCEPSYLEGVLAKLSCVRVLRIMSWKMNVVPSGSIGKLTHLRYVDFSECRKLKELPESICDLFCLQILNISGCSDLEKLPKGMGKLINLRHLYNLRSADQLPKGMERYLSSLQTLSMLNVGESRLDINHDLLGLGDLQNLNSLQGRFWLRGIKGGMVEVEEAEKAALQSKTGISSLYLVFDRADDDGVYSDDEGVMNRMIHRLKVLEALKPYKDLEQLYIEGYNGQSYARWISGDWLSNVKQITLVFCQPSLLPPIGTLPSLASLEIWKMSGVRSVGEEFLGIEESHLASSSSSHSLVAFPKLKTLKFFQLPEWETWADPKHNIIIMPSLSKLEIEHCRKLKSLPRFLARCENLQELEIIHCPLIEGSIRDGCEKQYGWVSNIPSVEMHSDSDSDVDNIQQPMVRPMEYSIAAASSSFQSASRLKSLICDDVDNILSLPAGCLPNVSCLTIQDRRLPDLSALGKVFRSLSSLQSLGIGGCDGLRSLSGGLEHLSSLERMGISNCKQLDLSAECMELVDMPWKALKGLRFLELDNIPKMLVLPDGLQHLTTLRSLRISENKELIALPEWISCFTSLESLYILLCPGVKSLPEGFRLLTCLQNLRIWDTSGGVLTERCRGPNGDDWPKIQHIPRVRVWD